MFVLSNLLVAVGKIINIILMFFYWAILIRALISWVNPDPYNAIVQFLYRVTEPILQPIRRILPTGRIDFSPIIAFILIIFLQAFLVKSINDVAYYISRPESQTIRTIEIAPEMEPQREEQPFFK